MKIYGICLVKDEDDIVAQTLEFGARYCEKIFVIDNGSADSTWDRVQELAKRVPAVVPFARRPEPYDEGLRWLAYDANHTDLSDQDWWLILDADEFLAEDPRPVIRKAMAEQADIINAWQIQFYYTEKDHEAWVAGRDSRERPILERRRYYRIDWQEPRLFRNQLTRNVIFEQSKLLTSTSRHGTSVSRSKGKVSRKRILNRHFQYRDPIQIEKRFRLRYGQPAFAAQVSSLDWRSAMRSSSGLNCHRDGDPWRFSVSGLAHCYSGWLQYVVRSRVRRVRTRYSDFRTARDQAHERPGRSGE